MPVHLPAVDAVVENEERQNQQHENVNALAQEFLVFPVGDEQHEKYHRINFKRDGDCEGYQRYFAQDFVFVFVKDQEKDGERDRKQNVVAAVRHINEGRRKDRRSREQKLFGSAALFEKRQRRQENEQRDDRIENELERERLPDADKAFLGELGRVGNYRDVVVGRNYHVAEFVKKRREGRVDHENLVRVVDLVVDDAVVVVHERVGRVGKKRAAKARPVSRVDGNEEKREKNRKNTVEKDLEMGLFLLCAGDCRLRMRFPVVNSFQNSCSVSLW